MFFGKGQCGLCHVPQYLHDRGLLTREDTVEFFNLILETTKSDAESRIAFLRSLGYFAR